MSVRPEKNRIRLGVELHGLTKALEELRIAKNETEGHLAWASFARHFKLSAELIVRIGKASVDLRREAWKLENEMRNNGTIQFIVNSRNDIDHPEDDGKNDLLSGKYVNSYSTLSTSDGKDSGIRIFGSDKYSVTIDIGDHVVDGTSFNANIVIGGKEDAIITGDLAEKKFRSAFKLRYVQLKKGERISVPINDETGEIFTANDLAEFGTQWLQGAMKKVIRDSEISL